MKLFITFVIFFIYILGPSAVISAEHKWKETIAKAENYLRSGSCENAWRLIWTASKQGSVEARSLVALYIINGRLYPAGYLNFVASHTETSSKTDKLIKSIIVHGAASGNRSLVIASIEDPSEYPEMSMKIRLINQCFVSSRNKSSCVVDAVRAGAVMSFERIVSSLEKDPLYRGQMAVCPGAIKPPNF